ncbi:MAG: hypothetical protein AAFY71_21765 [Bacteroidota bacterium]
MKKYIPFILLWIAFDMQGCSGEILGQETPIEDTLAPEVMVFQPANEQTYGLGDSIALEMDVSENFKLHDIFVELKKSSDDEVLWDYYVHSHLKSYSVREVIPVGLLSKGTYVLLIESRDHDYNTTNVLRTFTIE